MKKLDITLLVLAVLLVGSYAVQAFFAGRYAADTNIDPADLSGLWDQVNTDRLLNSACKDGDVKVYFATDKSSVNDRIFVPIVTWPAYGVDRVYIK